MDLTAEDKLQIPALAATYCHALDSGDASAVVGTFTDSGVLETARRCVFRKRCAESFFLYEC